MPTRNVVLTVHHQRLVEDLVHSGRYQNASEVLREGLRLIEQREIGEAAKLAALKEASAMGFGALDAGQYTDLAPGGLEAFIADLGRRGGRRGNESV